MGIIRDAFFKKEMVNFYISMVFGLTMALIIIFSFTGCIRSDNRVYTITCFKKGESSFGPEFYEKNTVFIDLAEVKNSDHCTVDFLN